MTIPAYCFRDTDGDGNCGRKHCPYCGPDRYRTLHPVLLRVIADLAADVWDEKTVVEHIAAQGTPEVVAGAMFRLVAEQFNYSGQNDGSYTPITYLEHLHTVWGYNHLVLIESLRDLASEIDPDAENRTYGKARQRVRTGAPRDRAPRNYAEQQALLEDTLRDIPPYDRGGRRT